MTINCWTPKFVVCIGGIFVNIGLGIPCQHQEVLPEEQWSSGQSGCL